MASIAAAVDRFNDNPLASIRPGRVESICRDCGHSWRKRELDPATTISLFMQQIIAGNCPCTEVRHWSDRSFTAQAYCDARARLPLAVYQALFHEVYQTLSPQMEDHLWHGHRTFHVDGSGFSMPDTDELREAFGVPSGTQPGCGFPTGHLLVLFSASTGLLIDLWASPLNTSDLAETPEAHLHLSPGDILIGDDFFNGYPHLAMLQKQGLHGLFPMHHQRLVDFEKARPHDRSQNVKGMVRSRWIKSLGKTDQLVEYFKPKQKHARLSDEEFDALPDSITVRELRRTVRRKGRGKITITLVTTLLDPVKYPAKELIQLRLRRWDVETDIGHLKTTMKMDVLRCKTEAGVRKELIMFGIVYNLVRGVMLEAAKRQKVPVRRISFIDVYKWMRHARPGDVLPPLIVNPLRPDRIEPRCKKRRPKKYQLMNRTRRKLQRTLQKQSKSV